MDLFSASLTVTFEDPFWIGLYERQEAGRYSVCKITFGAEPKAPELYAFLQQHWNTLSFSPPLPLGSVHRPHRNPKRQQREIRKALRRPAVSTKAQLALSRQREARAQERSQRARQRKQAQEQCQTALRQEKRRAKRRGR